MDKKSSIIHSTNLNDNDIDDEKFSQSFNTLMQSSDQRRIVFVSLIGAYQTWQQCSSDALYCSIFLLPLKRKWIYDLSKYPNQIDEYFWHKLGIDASKITQFPKKVLEFIEILKYKDAQGLAFWMMDKYEYPRKNMEKRTLIKPFWYSLSAKICSLHCPISGSKYNPLQLNEAWWRDETCFNHRTSKYDTAYTDVLFEFYSLEMIFKSIQEIIYQSNPHSLCPVVRIGENGPVFKNLASVAPYVDLDKKYGEIKKGNWWVAEDYDTSD